MLTTGKCPHSGWHIHCWECGFSDVPSEDKKAWTIPQELKHLNCELLDIAFVESVASIVGKQKEAHAS